MNNYLVEFLGTMFFVYIILATGTPVAIGAALTIAIIAASKTSGGNFNPAVSLALIAAGKLPMREFVPYAVSQIAGGLAAVQLYKIAKI